MPPIPEATYVGASTAVVPVPHEGDVLVPPDTTVWPAALGMHSHPGVTAQAAEHAIPNTAATIATEKPLAHM